MKRKGAVSYLGSLYGVMRSSGKKITAEELKALRERLKKSPETKIGYAAFSAVIAGALLLCACGRSGAYVSATAEPSKGINIETFSERSETSASEPAESETEYEYLPLPETAPPETAEAAEGFEFPEEFYQEINAVIEKYQLNEGCDGTEECACEPEYEVADQDGNIIIPRKKTLSVYFCDLESGYEYTLNPGAHYPVASTVKIPFCELIYQRIESGGIDPETVLTYEPRHYFEGTGEIVKGEFGQQFTVSELLTLAITLSDNVAYEMLKDLLPWKDFSDYLSANGCTHETDIRQSKQKICCESAGVYGKLLAGYLRSDGEYSEKFGEDLQNTRQAMIVSSYPMYRKYGWAGFSFHDIAYIDAPRPYVLAILSNLENEQNADVVIFKEISEIIERYSQGFGSAGEEF